jgi:hypothetical protein
VERQGAHSALPARAARCLHTLRACPKCCRGPEDPPPPFDVHACATPLNPRVRAQPTLSVDVVPIKTVTKAVTGGVAFAVGKSLDVAPRIKLGKLPLKVCLCVCVCAFVLACGWRGATGSLALMRRPRRSQLEVGAQIYKEGGEQTSEGATKDDVLCLRIKSVNAIVNL